MSGALTEVLNACKVLVQAVTDVVSDNVFTRQVTPKSKEDYHDKFWDKTGSQYIGVQIYMGGSPSGEFLGFNKTRKTYTIVTDTFLGTKDRADGDSHSDIEDITDRIQNKFAHNLTCSGQCFDSEFPEKQEISLIESEVGLMWVNVILWDVYVDEIFSNSIS